MAFVLWRLGARSAISDGVQCVTIHLHVAGSARTVAVSETEKVCPWLKTTNHAPHSVLHARMSSPLGTLHLTRTRPSRLCVVTTGLIAKLVMRQ